MDNQPAAVITLKEVYDELVALNRQLAPLLDPQIGVIVTQQRHDARLTSLEKKVYAIPSLATVIATGSLGWAIFGK